jgi:hypothetical protein
VSHYVRIPNSVARGKLSLEAVGLYAYLASSPHGWEFSLAGNRPWPNGYKATQLALSELRAHGLISAQRRGQTADGHFDYFMDVHLSPVDNSPHPVDNYRVIHSTVRTSPRAVEANYRKKER